jgi:predicted alpha-1,6-mannanase (GH76 family)
MKIISVFEQSGLRIKWSWKPEWSDIDKVLFKWFKQERSDNVPVSGPRLIMSAFPKF